MSFRCLLVACLIFVVNCEYVRKKFCSEVDQSQCKINYVTMDPCGNGPMFCRVNTNKIYDINVNFTPRFTADSMRYAVYGDVDHTHSFGTIIDEPKSACNAVDCPLTETSHSANFKLKLDKRASGKFPIKVKFWNQDNSSQVCCFTIRVKSNNFNENEI